MLHSLFKKGIFSDLWHLQTVWGLSRDNSSFFSFLCVWFYLWQEWIFDISKTRWQIFPTPLIDHSWIFLSSRNTQWNSTVRKYQESWVAVEMLLNVIRTLHDPIIWTPSDPVTRHSDINHFRESFADEVLMSIFVTTTAFDLDWRKCHTLMAAPLYNMYWKIK